MSDEEKVKVWMPLFIGAYLADTQRLSTEQHGAYLLLIMDYWMNGAPSDDDAELAQITKLSMAAWKKMKGKIAKFFRLQDGCWVHKRIEEELAAAKKHKTKSVEKAKIAAAARWSKHNPEQSSTDAPSNAPSMPQALPEEVPEGVLKPCPIPLPTTTKTKGSNTASGELTVVGESEEPIRAVDLSIALRESNIDSQPSDPRLIALAEQGITPAMVRSAAKHARKSKPNERIATGYVVSIIQRWSDEAKRLAVTGAQAPPRNGNARDESRAAAAASIGLGGDGHGRSSSVIEGNFREVS